MGIISDALNDWLKPVLIEGIQSNLESLFASVNSELESVTTMIGKTPKEWNSGIYSTVKSISDAVILPAAGVVIAAVMAMELIQMILEKNNQQDMDIWMIFKWIIRAFFAVTLVSNSWTIVMGIFDWGKYMVTSVTGLLGGSTAINVDDSLPGMMLALQSETLGALFGLYLLSFLIKISGLAIAIFIFIVIFGRIIEIYMVTSVAPVTLATTFNRSWGNIGTNYLRLLLSLALQALLIMVAIAIYIALIQDLPKAGEDVALWMVKIVGYTALLCVSLSKTGSLAKSLLGAH